MHEFAGDAATRYEETDQNGAQQMWHSSDEPLDIDVQIVEGLLSNQVGAFELLVSWRVVIENETVQHRKGRWVEANR